MFRTKCSFFDINVIAGIVCIFNSPPPPWKNIFISFISSYIAFQVLPLLTLARYISSDVFENDYWVTKVLILRVSGLLYSTVLSSWLNHSPFPPKGRLFGGRLA